MLSRRTLDANPHRTRNGWIPSAIIIFITIVLFFVAFCIVISLLPTYLPDKTITGITTNGQSTFLSVRYLTYADLTGKTVANTVNVGQQLSTQLGLPSSALSVQSTQFQSAATTGKRKRQFFRILSTLRERRQTSIKGTFIIIVKINFPSTVCKTTFCENNYSNKVKSKIYAVPTVPISFTFTDGTNLDINIFFQALEDVSSGTTTGSTITTSTSASSSITSNAPTDTTTTTTSTTTSTAGSTTTITDTTTTAGTTTTITDTTTATHTTTTTT
ncbi:unnamed protein product [Rotaria magnacalcarata]|uniref:Uncharacterized protein n=2 Tax=Rotaria magnacalcarata TaxID=392030 RepID=A0A816LJQ7_9BILA|nr:unnamed protein product [Rotaria magnacalcarata]